MPVDPRKVDQAQATAASVFVPFRPMMPIHILANNLLYAFSQMLTAVEDGDTERSKMAALGGVDLP